MKQNMLIIGLAVFLCTTFSGNSILAQEQEPEEIELYSFGSVVSVSANKIVISEYDYEQEKEVNIAYMINNKTKLINADSVEEIVPDDLVDITYWEVEGENIAIIIEKVSLVTEEEGEGWETFEKEPEEEPEVKE